MQECEVYMLLVAAATEKELEPIRQFVAAAEHLDALVTGMGPVMTAATLTNYLSRNASRVRGVINIGVGGAYVGSDVGLLDICLARQEVLGDFGICMSEEIVDFNPELTCFSGTMQLDKALSALAETALRKHGIAFKRVNFVTVNCCTGTRQRGEYLRKKFTAGCENMEGAAVAMVGGIFNVPVVELRCISNLVEDRNPADWQIAEAAARVCRAAELILSEYVSPGLMIAP